MAIATGTAILGSTAMNIGAGVMQSMFGRSSAKTAQKRQYKYALKYDHWGPSAKMEGLKRAGINPILAFGSGKGMPSNYVGGAPVVTPPNVQMPDVGATAQAISKSSLNLEQIRTEVNKQMQYRANAGMLEQQEKALWQQTWNLVQEFNHITQKAYHELDKRGLTRAQEKLIHEQVSAIQYNMEKLARMSDVYEGAAGEIIAYLNAILGNIGIGAGFNLGVKK